MPARSASGEAQLLDTDTGHETHLSTGLVDTFVAPHGRMHALLLTRWKGGRAEIELPLVRATRSESRDDPRSLGVPDCAPDQHSSVIVTEVTNVVAAGLLGGRRPLPVARALVETHDRRRIEHLRGLGKWGQQQEMALDDRCCDVGEFVSVALGVGA